VKFRENPPGDLADARTWGSKCALHLQNKKKIYLRIRSLWIALVNALRSTAGRSKRTNVMSEGENARKRIRNEVEE
jgi:hypothetical protein